MSSYIVYNFILCVCCQIFVYPIGSSRERSAVPWDWQIHGHHHDRWGMHHSAFRSCRKCVLSTYSVLDPELSVGDKIITLAVSSGKQVRSLLWMLFVGSPNLLGLFLPISSLPRMQRNLFLGKLSLALRMPREKGVKADNLLERMANCIHKSSLRKEPSLLFHVRVRGMSLGTEMWMSQATRHCGCHGAESPLRALARTVLLL